MGSVRCSSCGEPAEWLVTVPYGSETKAGRILSYCTSCRGGPQPVLVSIPLVLVDDETFAQLYKLGYSESAPDFAAEIVFGEKRDDLAEHVAGYLDPLAPSKLFAHLQAARSELPTRLTTTERGVYALWLDEEAYATLGLTPGVDGVAYVGIGDGGRGLAGRYAAEWRPNNSGRSSPRRTLGALLMAELGLTPRPRPGAAHPRNADSYVFGDDGENALTAWLDKRAEFAFVEIPASQLGENKTLGQVERDLIEHLRPPVNLNKWKNPHKPRLSGARKDAARAAARWSG